MNAPMEPTGKNVTQVTNLPARKASASATTTKRAKAILAKRPAASHTTMIIASDAVKAKQVVTLVDTLVAINFHETASERGIDVLVTEMERYRRMFPAKDAVQEILGTDAPDLIGGTEAYKSAWTKVQSAARAALSERFQAEFKFPSEAADTLAKSKVDTERKNVSVKYRNLLEKQVRESLSNPVDRARFMLAHGFKFSTVVTGTEACIPITGATLKDGAVVIPGHVVDAKKGTIKAIPATTTPGNQQGQGTGGDTIKTAASALTTQFTEHASKHDFVGLLGDAQFILSTILSTTIPADLDLATRARAMVDLERMLVKVTQHAEITPEAYKAARNYKPAAPKAPALSEEAKAEEFAAKLEAEKAPKVSATK